MTTALNPEVVGSFTEPDYYAELARLRQDEPVRQYAPNSWTVARYDDVRAVSRDPERFCSGRGVLLNDPLRSGGGVEGSILHMDPPQHAPWRGLVTRRFTPRAISTMEDRIRAVARSVLAEVGPGEEIDFVDAVAAPFPVLVIAELLGIDADDRDKFRRWSDAAIETPDNPGEKLDDLVALFQFLLADVRARREQPTDDIASAVVHAEVEGEPVTTKEAVGYLLALLVAGNETTRHLVSGSALTLAQYPEQRALLTREPTRISGAIEECLRWVTPIQVFGRTATRNTELGGRPIAEGDFVVMLYASANRDEDAFGPTASEFDVTRPVDSQHLAFGFGEHLCVGAALARLEGRVFLEELLARFPDYEVTGEPELSRSTLVRGATADAGSLSVTATIAALVAARAGDDNTGLLFEGRSWTWAEVAHECAVRAAVLQATRGPGPFHVGVLLDNVPEYVFLLGGAALAGATIVGINPTRRGEELAHDIRHADCGIVVTEAAYAPLLAGLDLGVEADRTFTVESDPWAQLLAAHATAAIPAALPGPETLFVLIFTSGSTGAPKAVRGTQGRFAGMGARMPFGPDDVLYCPMPLFHGNALASNFVPAFTAGATIALRRKFSASEFFADLRAVDATYFNTVGRALSYMLATPPAADDRDHRVKFALAPESSATDAAAFRARFGIPLVGGYGSSEGAIIITPIRDGKPGALGVPAEGTDIAVVDPATGAECPRAELDENGALLNAAEATGEIVRRDPRLVFEGYYNNDEATAERNRNGWYWSGDLGYRDADGVFYFAGRTADWIRVDGENFAAAPIERIVERHPGVAAVAVYGVPDPVTGDQVMAALELRAGTTFDPQEFGAFLDAQRDLGTKWAPRFVRVVTALPVTGTDKIAKLPLRAAGWSRAGGMEGDVWWRPGRDGAYEPLTAAAEAQLAARFAEHGRTALLPNAGRASAS